MKEKLKAEMNNLLPEQLFEIGRSDIWRGSNWRRFNGFFINVGPNMALHFRAAAMGRVSEVSSSFHVKYRAMESPSATCIHYAYY